MTSIILPSAFPLVGLGLLSATFLTVWQSNRVMAARKVAGVNYPTMMVSEAEAKADPKKMAYNCTQRTHQNTIENLPIILAATIFLGIFNPILATGGIMTWVFGRIFYTVQYSSGVPSKRNNGLALTSYLGVAAILFGHMYYAATQSYAYLTR